MRAQTQGLSAEDVNIFLPASRHVVRSGRADPRIRVNGYPNETLTVALEAPFENFALRDQPDLLPPQTGTLTALASYEAPSRLLRLAAARVDTEQLSGRIEGDISFAEGPPAFHLRLEASQTPLRQLLDLALPDTIAEYGELEMDFPETQDIYATLEGTSEEPVISIEAGVDNGSISFVPADANLPSAELTFGLIKLSWTSGAKLPGGAVNIVDGTLTHKPMHLAAERLAGVLRFEEGHILLDPLSAEITGNAFVGTLDCDVEQRLATFSASALVDDVQKSPLSRKIKKLAFAGTMALRCTGTLREDRIQLDIAADLSQAQVDYEWWLRKPPGVGANVERILLDIEPKRKMTLDGKATVGGSPIEATIAWNYEKGKFETEEARVKLGALDVDTADKCLRVSYAASGETATEGYFHWDRVHGAPKANVSKVGGYIDHAMFLPYGQDTPLDFTGARVDVVLDNSTPGAHTATMTLDVKEASVPPLGKKWLLPLRPSELDVPEAAGFEEDTGLQVPGWYEEEPQEPRTWEYTLCAETLHMLPWEGTQFIGDTFSNGRQSGLRHFSATIGDGNIEGSFISTSEENFRELTATWTNIPAVYLLRHLEFPELIESNMDGEFAYTVDSDDPGTLRGKGWFEARNGKFNAEGLRAQFKSFFEQNGAALPDALDFDRFRADIELEGDIVHTRNIAIDGHGMTITGGGQYVLDADMDYEIRVVIQPETAEQMPLLKQYLNVEGHKLTQNPIELAFHVKGPTYKPSSTVVGLPSVGVTLVSGAGQMASQAMRVIDSPRQILLDMVKIVGGIAGAGTAPNK